MLKREAQGSTTTPGTGPGSHKAALAAVISVSLVSNLLLLTGPLFMLQVYDRVLASRSVPTLVALGLLALALYAFYAVLEVMRSRIMARLAGLFERQLSASTFRASIRAKLQPGVMGNGDAIRDLDSLRQFLSGGGPLALLDLPWMPIYLVLVFLLHPLLGGLALAGAVILAVLLLINELMSRSPSRALIQATNARQGLFHDVRGNAEAVVSMGMLDDMTRRWSASADAVAGLNQRATDNAAVYSSITKSFRLLLQSAVLGVGAFLAIRGDATAGVMIAASVITARALSPVEQVVAHWRGFLGARQAWGRLRSALASMNMQPQRLQLPRPMRLLQVENISSAPAGAAKPVIQGINFTLTAGQSLGVIGLSASGKSSLARALVGIWPTQSGHIRFDGSDFAHFDPREMGRYIGYLPQTVELFDGTIAQNISRFRSDATDDKVLKAARDAGVHDLIAWLPDGYETRVGERASLLSAGQRQRIGLARALYDEPFLIVLDEPNSNLDAEADAALTQSLLQATARGAIVIVIAHRPSAIAAVEQVLYMKDGRQIAFGRKNAVLQSISGQPPGKHTDIGGTVGTVHSLEAGICRTCCPTTNMIAIEPVTESTSAAFVTSRGRSHLVRRRRVLRLRGDERVKFNEPGPRAGVRFAWLFGVWAGHPSSSWMAGADTYPQGMLGEIRRREAAIRCGRCRRDG